MRPGQDIEGGLEAAVIGQSPPVGGQQRLVAGMGDGGLFEHRGGLRPLSGSAQRLAITQRRGGILRIGAIALAIDLDRAPRIGVGDRLRLRRDRAGDIGHRLAAAEPGGQNRRHGRGSQKPGKAGLLTHGTFNSRYQSDVDQAECASNKALTLMPG